MENSISDEDLVKDEFKEDISNEESINIDDNSSTIESSIEDNSLEVHSSVISSPVEVISPKPYSNEYLSVNDAESIYKSTSSEHSSES